MSTNQSRNCSVTNMFREGVKITIHSPEPTVAGVEVNDLYCSHK
jgi:hypothetical protein